jgi:hypothetical protein
MQKSTFLVCYDYGTGGVWFLMDAKNTDDINKLHPQFNAFIDKPEWMDDEDKEEYVSSAKARGHHWDIDDEPEGWLKECLSE